jgi:hypothetical protein
MPGFLVHVGATVMCAHGGQAQPTVPQPRVMVSGQPVVTLAGPYVVAGCAFPPPPSGNGPCLTGEFVDGTTRVLAMGLPIVVNASQAVCVSTGTPLIVAVTQPRVSGM